MKRFLFILLIAALFSCNSENQSKEEPLDITTMTDGEIVEYAQGIHDRVITLDTHDDINVDNFTLEKNYTMDLETQITLQKMEDGGLDVAWFIVYTGQGDLTEEGYEKALENAMSKFDAIHRLCEEIAPDRIALATTSEEVRQIQAEGKLVAMIGVENAFPIGMDISKVKEFYDLGGRYMSPAHNRHSQLSDSHTGEEDDDWMHNGLSDFGKEVIREMNKWGIMVDVSHPSKKAFMDMIELTKAPLIGSHSAARALSDESRNMDDEQLLKLKENGGVIQTVALRSFVNTEKNKKRRDALNEINKVIAAEMGFEIVGRRAMRDMSEDDREIYRAKMKELRERAGPKIAEEVDPKFPDVDVGDFIDQVDYLVNLIGIDHVGISSDFDGGGGIQGWDDSSETFNVTLEMVHRGYTEEEISKIWSGNLLRVLDEVQAVAAQIQSAEAGE